MAHSIGISPGDHRLADLQADLSHKLQHGTLTIEELALFTQRKNPFAFERNEHGHIVIEVTGLDLTGAQEIERLTAAGFRFSSWAQSCLLSEKHDGYDAKHRIVEGERYKFALMPNAEIETLAERTTENLRKRGIERYGYGKPLAGGIPRIRERVSDKQMEEMGFWYIAAPHDPIEDPGGGPSVLFAGRGGAGRWVRAAIARPLGQWGVGGAFAFPVPAS